MIQPYIVIIGPTASGKSQLAMDICRAVDGEIVSCDSVQVYRQVNIGAAKPSTQDLNDIPHHLINLVELEEDYDAGRYAKEARLAVRDIQSRGKVAVLVGGTGLYLRSFLAISFILTYQKMTSYGLASRKKVPVIYLNF